MALIIINTSNTYTMGADAICSMLWRTNQRELSELSRLGISSPSGRTKPYTLAIHENITSIKSSSVYTTENTSLYRIYYCKNIGLIICLQMISINDMQFDGTHHQTRNIDSALLFFSKQTSYQVGLTLLQRLGAKGHRA